MDAKLNRNTSATGQREPALAFACAPMCAALVLDTNVVLDWLLFGDASAAPLAAAIERRRVRWIATAAMRGEFAEVLRRGLAAARAADPVALLATWDAHVEPHRAAQGLPGAVALRCSDPDDQMFLDLAYGAGARWLVSRDRAVLRLARRAAALGIAITAPEHWSAPP